MRLEFFLPMTKVPTATHQEQAVQVVKGKPVFYDTPEVKAARAKLTGHLAKHAPEKPLRGAVRLLVKWCFPRDKSHRDGEYRTSRPDTDNLQKLLKDCMTKCGFWKDDAQVASEICEKFWADIPGLYICAEEITAKREGLEANPCLFCDCWDGDAEGCTMPPEDKTFACPLESEADRLCGNCRWYAEFEGVCTNGESEYRADFRESGDTCPQWKA